MESTQEVLQQERADTKSRLAKLVEIGGPIFEQTALVQKREFREDDVSKVREFFEKSKPFIHPNLWLSYWDHVDLARSYARVLGKRLQSKGVPLNPFELEVLAMTHDIGRLISPHRYFRTNLVGESLLKKLEVREDLRRKQVPEAKLFGREGNITAANQLTIEQQVLLLADNLGRRTENGNLITLEQFREIGDQQAQLYTGEVFASERFGKKRLVQTDKKTLQLLGEIKQTLQDQYGISIDEVREEVGRKASAPS